MLEYSDNNITIGRLCDLGAASIQTGPFGSQLHAHDYRLVGTPVIPTEAIGRRRIDNIGLPRVDDDTVARLARHKLIEGDILFARRGAQATGLSAIVTKEHEGALCGTGAILMRIMDRKRISPVYLSFALSAERAIKWLKDHAVGAVMPNLNADVIRRLAIYLPPVAIQHAIADVLGALDDKIALNCRMNETLEAMARALFKSWFVDFDPVRAKMASRPPAGMNNTTAVFFPNDLDERGIPKGWRRAGLGSWAETLSGGTPSKSDPSLWNGMIPWISPKVMTNLHADQADVHVAESAIGNGTRLAPARSTLVMVRGMGLHEKVRVSQARREVTFNQDVKALVPHGIEPSLLLFALLHGQKELLGKVESSGHGTGKLPTEILLAYEITMPPGAVQAQLTKLFDDIGDRIAAAREESRTLAALRDALLPKLLSGELRIRDAEREVEKVA